MKISDELRAHLRELGSLGGSAKNPNKSAKSAANAEKAREALKKKREAAKTISQSVDSKEKKDIDIISGLE